ncbi:hypothetical protein HanRHA438_Chr13g0600141 [Helianthus annuus]|nr:hypothetical protein HanRHA438_Chr13g0600141 [Helianthus annuus]
MILLCTVCGDRKTRGAKVETNESCLLLKDQHTHTNTHTCVFVKLQELSRTPNPKHERSSKLKG